MKHNIKQGERNTLTFFVTLLIKKSLHKNEGIFCISNYENILGNNIEIAGMYVITNNTIIITAKNGIIPFITSSSVVSPTREATNKFTPKGGVINPIAKFTTIIIPKCVTSTPKAVTVTGVQTFALPISTGNNIGANIIIAHNVSIKQPTISNNTLISNNINILLSVIVVKNVATVVGIRPNVNTFEKPAAQPITIRIVAVVSQAFFVTVPSCFKSSSLYTRQPITRL